MQKKGISLFSGAGGMDVGFKNAGFDILWANDINQDACNTYAANHGEMIECGNIDGFLPQLKKYEDIDVVFGGPPCQGFSVAGKMDPNDPRSHLIWSFMDVVEMVRPKAFVLENVSALAKLTRWVDVRQELAKRAIKLGYAAKILVLNASEYGVPQSRERMFFIGFREIKDLANLDNCFIPYQREAPKLRNILLNLGVAGNPKNSRICRAKVTLATKPVLRRSPYAGMLFNGQGRPLNPDGYCSTLPASMGGNRTPIIDENHLYFSKESWVEWYHSKLMKGHDPLPFDSAPDCLRRLTIDEALRLQTFPDDYEFIGKQSSIFTQIGNAVPCLLAEAVASTVCDILFKNSLTEAKEKFTESGQQLPLAM